VHWVHVYPPPRGRRKKLFRPNLQGKVVSAPPRQSKSPFFKGNWGDSGGGEGYLVSYSVFWERRLKRSSTFLGKKNAPQTKSWWSMLVIASSSTSSSTCARRHGWRAHVEWKINLRDDRYGPPYRSAIVLSHWTSCVIVYYRRLRWRWACRRVYGRNQRLARLVSQTARPTSPYDWSSTATPNCFRSTALAMTSSLTSSPSQSVSECMCRIT